MQPNKVFCTSSLLLQATLPKIASSTSTPVTLPSDTPDWVVTLSKQMTALNTNFKVISEQIGTLYSRIATVELGPQFISGKTTTMQVALSYRNTYEVSISGIPRELFETNKTIDYGTKKFIMAFGYKRALSHINSTKLEMTQEIKVTSVQSWSSFHPSLRGII